MTSDSEFVAFINHNIQLVLDLTVYSNIWAVLSILLETQDVNTSYMQMMHDYYNQCYDTRTQNYMVLIEKVAEQCRIMQDSKDPLITTDFYLTNVEPREWILPTPPTNNEVPASNSAAAVASNPPPEIPADPHQPGKI